MNVTLQKQEYNGNYKFSSQLLYTRGFEAEFGEDVLDVILTTLRLIHHLVANNVADYFQVAFAENTQGEKVKFYVIDDIDHITFLLPYEY